MLFWPIAKRIKGFDTFPKGIRPKVNVIVRQEHELTYFEGVVQYVSHYAMETCSCFGFIKKLTKIFSPTTFLYHWSLARV